MSAFFSVIKSASATAKYSVILSGGWDPKKRNLLERPKVLIFSFKRFLTLPSPKTTILIFSFLIKAIVSTIVSKLWAFPIFPANKILNPFGNLFFTSMFDATGL